VEFLPCSVPRTSSWIRPISGGISGRSSLKSSLSDEIGAPFVQDTDIWKTTLASRRNGLWMGGRPVLGYDLEEKRLIINAEEAAHVGEIFRLFIKTGSMVATVTEVNRRGWTTETWQTQGGKVRGRIARLEHEAIDEQDLKTALASFTPIWTELFPRERARILHLLIEEVMFDAR